jgi:hypothetical protein
MYLPGVSEGSEFLWLLRFSMVGDKPGNWERVSGLLKTSRVMGPLDWPIGERLPKLGRVDILEAGGLYLLERWSAIAIRYSSAYDI